MNKIMFDHETFGHIVDRSFVFFNDIHSSNKFSKQKKIVDHFRMKIVKLKHALSNRCDPQIC
jgi:hypothetical protein